MNKHNLALLAVLGTMMAVAPGALRALPDPAPAKPAPTAADLAKIEAAARKRQMRQAKLLKCRPRPRFCEHCHDGYGGTVYPYYGVGPHICGWRMGKPVVGHSKGLPKQDWPENFQPDPEHGDQDDGKPPLGVWTHCLHCGAGKGVDE